MLTEFWNDFLWINWTHNEHEYFKNFSGVLTHLEKPGPANPSESSLLITKHTFVYRELFWSYRSVKQIKWCLKDKFHFPGIHNCSWCFNIMLYIIYSCRFDVFSGTSILAHTNATLFEYLCIYLTAWKLFNVTFLRNDKHLTGRVVLALQGYLSSLPLEKIGCRRHWTASHFFLPADTYLIYSSL